MSATDVVEVGPKRRVVIPAAIRKRLGIEQGTRLAVLVDAGAVVLVPRTTLEQRLHSIFNGLPSSIADEQLEQRGARLRSDGVDAVSLICRKERWGIVPPGHSVLLRLRCYLFASLTKYWV